MQKFTVGFSLMEFVIATTIIAILAALSLPDEGFSSDEAHQASVAGTGAAFSEGVRLAHYYWIAERYKGAVMDITNLADDNNKQLDMNASGWPVGTDDAIQIHDPGDCLSIWQAVLQKNRPLAAIAIVPHIHYLVTASSFDQSCTFTYQLRGKMYIQYFAETGKVIINNSLN